MREITGQVRHRPWPLPKGPWVMAQRWHELLFAHWVVPASLLRPLIPSRLEIDTRDGQAWLGVIPFRMSGVRLRGTPPVPGLSAFPELNVRSYVTCDGKPGVWFFSLDAGNAIAVAVARTWFHLPYFRARMRSAGNGEWIEYRSERTHSDAPPAKLQVRYRACGTEQRPEPGTLAHWLTERYCLYAADARENIYCGEIHHAPWKLTSAESEFEANTMAEGLGVELPRMEPVLYFAERQEVLVWPPRRLSPARRGRTQKARSKKPASANR
ncbi:MAG TPA: DUF2071 domain-containing protein [Candidatus Solibacter sp.]|nr:DUF2071 domain-containing protein [Candidatus Solibacter sp.]